MKAVVFWLKFNKFILSGPIDNMSSLVQIMAQCLTDKPLPEPVFTQIYDAMQHHKVTMSWLIWFIWNYDMTYTVKPLI